MSTDQSLLEGVSSVCAISSFNTAVTLPKRCKNLNVTCVWANQVLRVLSIPQVGSRRSFLWQTTRALLAPLGFVPDTPPLVREVLRNENLVENGSETLVVHEEQTIVSVDIELLIYLHFANDFLNGFCMSVQLF